MEQLRANMRAARGRDSRCNQILSAPTGAGKTVIASYLMAAVAERRKRALFVVDRLALVKQTSEMFDKYGIPHGIIQGDHWRTEQSRWRFVNVASAQTLARRGWPPDIDLIVVDEAHTMFDHVLKRMAARDCDVLGLTATPFTRGLGAHYDQVVNVRTTRQLIDEGYLVPYVVYAATEPDMTGVKVSRTTGEWDASETTSRVLPIVGDVVAEYLRHGGGKKFICFGVTVAHCEELQRQFLAAGIVCGLYTNQTGDEERDRLTDDFKVRGGNLRGLISVAALSKGFDNEQVECVIIARPLRKSLAEHIQIIGRGLRVDAENPEKRCIILDHAGNCARFWADTEAFFNDGVRELDDGKRRPTEAKKVQEREPVKCPKCTHLHAPRPSCPNCGHEYPPRPSGIHHVPGQLQQVGGQSGASRAERQAFYAQLRSIMIEKGKAEAWARNMYRDKFGRLPNDLREEVSQPTQAVRNFVKATTIAFFARQSGGKAGKRRAGRGGAAA